VCCSNEGPDRGVELSMFQYYSINDQCGATKLRRYLWYPPRAGRAGLNGRSVRAFTWRSRAVHPVQTCWACHSLIFPLDSWAAASRIEGPGLNPWFYVSIFAKAFIIVHSSAVCLQGYLNYENDTHVHGTFLTSTGMWLGLPSIMPDACTYEFTISSAFKLPLLMLSYFSWETL
jgi:hypothetical protein